MDIGLATLGLAALAGLLTVVNPCVLPILPIVLGAATASSRTGLFTLAAGMALAFASTGTLLASSGQVLGVDSESMRTVAATLMLGAGLLLVSARLQSWFSRATARVPSLGDAAIARLDPGRPEQQFATGALLGLVWTPCVGPTLGAAIALAAQGEALAQVALVMSVFALGAVIPLVGVGLASRAGFTRRRERALRLGSMGKALMGWGLLLIGLLVLTGTDKWLEALLLDHAPDFLIDLTTRL